MQVNIEIGGLGELLEQLERLENLICEAKTIARRLDVDRIPYVQYEKPLYGIEKSEQEKANADEMWTTPF